MVGGGEVGYHGGWETLQGYRSWKRYWQIFRWKGLQGADRIVAKELVEKAYAEMDLRGWKWEVDKADCDLILFQ
jgi:hypothetical protein